MSVGDIIWREAYHRLHYIDIKLLQESFKPRNLSTEVLILKKASWITLKFDNILIPTEFWGTSTNNIK